MHTPVLSGVSRRTFLRVERTGCRYREKKARAVGAPWAHVLGEKKSVIGAYIPLALWHGDAGAQGVDHRAAPQNQLLFVSPTETNRPISCASFNLRLACFRPTRAVFHAAKGGKNTKCRFPGALTTSPSIMPS